MTLLVPYISQLGETAKWGAGDCGPTELAQYLNSVGFDVTPDVVSRDVLKKAQGYTSASLRELQTAGSAYDVKLHWGRFDNRNGNVDWIAVKEMLKQQHPIIALVYYPLLPIRYDLRYDDGHFVTIVGMEGDMVIYHDPYWPGSRGAYLSTSTTSFARAWLATGKHAKTPAQGLYDVDRTVPVKADASTWAKKIESIRWNSEEADREMAQTLFLSAQVRIQTQVTVPLNQLVRLIKSGKVRIVVEG